MICFALKCTRDHRFESWFQSSIAFDELLAQGLVTCPECDSNKVEKSIMAPRVQAGRGPDLTTPENDNAKALHDLRKKVEAESEYVGMQFATEARAIHDGDAPERAIYGEAKPEEALKLVEDGVKVTPLPFLPTRKTN